MGNTPSNQYRVVERLAPCQTAVTWLDPALSLEVPAVPIILQKPPHLSLPEPVALWPAVEAPQARAWKLVHARGPAHRRPSRKPGITEAGLGEPAPQNWQTPLLTPSLVGAFLGTKYQQIKMIVLVRT